MRKGLKEWNYEAPSKFRASSGKTIGDDLCSPIPRDIRRPGLEVSDNFHVQLEPKLKIKLTFFNFTSARILLCILRRRMDRYGIEETRTVVLQSEEASSLLTFLKYRANNFLIYIPRTLLSLSLHARDTINTF